MLIQAAVDRALAARAAAAAADAAAAAAADADAALAEIADDINAGRAALLKLVECLGPVLTHTDPFRREAGVALLAAVLARTTKERISTQSATVLAQFLLSRLDDQPSVEPALNGLLAMLDLGVLSKTEQINIPTRIFAELNVQTFQQSVRNTVFRIFVKLFDANLPGLQKLGAEFVLGFIHVMDGEKDPRNLILAFRLAQLITRHLDFQKHAEDLFEVVFCYFPITFRPLPNDPFGVTADDLRTELCAVVSSTKAFAPYAVPVLLEKATSDSASAKRDAMEAVAACAPVYGGDAFLPHISDFWTAMRNEMINAADTANELAALKAIRELAKALSITVAAPHTRATPLESFLSLLIQDCLQNLADPALKFAKPSGKIMMSAASASEPACSFVISKTLPVILGAIASDSAPSKRKTLCDVLGDFIVANRLVYGQPKPGGDLDVNGSPILKQRDRLFELFVGNALTDSYVPLKLSSLRALQDMLLTPRLLRPNEEKVVLELLLSWLLAEPDTNTHEAALEAAPIIAGAKPALAMEVIVEQTSLLAALRTMDTGVAPVWDSPAPVDATFAYLFAAVLSNSLPEVGEVEKVVCAPPFADRAQADLPIGTFGAFADASIIRAVESGSALFSLATAKSIASVVNKRHGQQGIDTFVEHFVQTHLQGVLLDKAAGADRRRSVLLIYSWIAKAFAIQSDKRGFEMASQILALLADEQLGAAAAEGLGTIISDDAHGALTKAAHANIKLLFKQRFYNHCLPAVAAGFRDASDAQKTAYLFALSHLLRNVPKGVLLNELPKVSRAQANFQLRYRLLTANLAKLLPMLLHSLSIPEASLKLGTLGTLQLMVREAPKLVAEQISTIVPLLLSMSMFANASNGNDPRVRVAALEILGQIMLSVEYTALHPFKPRVTRELIPALDDPKRVVRKAAANTRSIWFMPAPTV
nr:mms19 nucleotide excision repair [Polyrhizophydium stewartii]